MKTPNSLIIVLFAIFFVPVIFKSMSQAQEIPDGYKQLLPRGGIPAISDPEYVSPEKSNIADDAFIFGIVIEDQPIAYSLDLLNGHEVVNDTIGDTNFAAVW